MGPVVDRRIKNAMAEKPTMFRSSRQHYQSNILIWLDMAVTGAQVDINCKMSSNHVLTAARREVSFQCLEMCQHDLG